jgi:hypothetical protein
LGVIQQPYSAYQMEGEREREREKKYKERYAEGKRMK